MQGTMEQVQAAVDAAQIHELLETELRRVAQYTPDAEQISGPDLGAQLVAPAHHAHQVRSQMLLKLAVELVDARGHARRRTP